ncbi:MAG: stage III sporulation protein AA [Clostridia bacterium]|nr:stage III sporulation protein AA [Clostridia bacterium]
MDIPQIKREILMQLPVCFRTVLSDVDFNGLQEVRFRCAKPLMIHTDSGDMMIAENGKPTASRESAYMVSAEEMAMLLAAFCENSVYAYQREICDGFLTIKGGHRVGISGRCVLSEGKIINVTDISGLNLRIAKEFKGCAESILARLASDNEPANIIIISPPQCGKTTILRDMARLISQNKKVTIIDERSELAAVKGGTAQFDVGIRTDVLDRFPKSMGMLLAIRSLSPDVIITDEIGGKEDYFAVKSVLNAGCRIITSMHGYDTKNLSEERREMLKMFDCAVVLTKKNGIPEVKEIVKLRGE